ncbi:hypothetical protein RDWZM_005414 [Blomia tropicalis]|uniref:Magnesium-dependent phosphatase 1 n=1 Tax=Blomia tropicalis TaxID=40697 RepID=A0A9Q0M8E7_BLOTA|nr:hypothetical protein RDWZM_005414 [Blomia tropicalis]
MLGLIRKFSTIAKESNIVKNSFPKLVVFDLDHTLWNFGIDSFCFTPPFHFEKSSDKLIDMSGKSIETFPDTLTVLKHLHSLNIPVAVASRTKYPSGAYSVLEKLKLDQYIRYFEIYPGQKMKHFSRLREQSGAEYSEMIFFDDEQRNIDDISKLGVCAVLVESHKGATESIVKFWLNEYSSNSNNK